MISIVNLSHWLSDTDAERCASVCQAQVALHLAPAWGVVPPTVVFAGRVIPKEGDYIAFADTDPTPGAAGYHTEDGAGRATGVIIVGVILDGGTPLTGPQSCSATLSHEVIEMVLDREINKWADGPDGYSYPVEGCDAVQSSGYVIQSPDATEVTVSNFLYPAWFDESPQRGSRFDYLGLLATPFTIDDGGYSMRRSAAGDVEQVGLRPDWKSLALTRSRGIARRA